MPSKSFDNLKIENYKTNSREYKKVVRGPMLPGQKVNL